MRIKSNVFFSRVGKSLRLTVWTNINHEGGGGGGGGGVSWSLIGYRCAAGTLLTHAIHVSSICGNAYLFIYTSHNLYPIRVFGTFK